MMSKIFITGSADGLGCIAARLLIKQGHQVVLHARNRARAKEALLNNPGAEIVLIADLAHANQTKHLATQVNTLGKFDAIIHNAAVYQSTGDVIFKVNTLAPYLLTCLIEKPERIVYMSSAMHLQGKAETSKFIKEISMYSYSDSKLHMLMLAKAVARSYETVFANAVNPGWVPTKMGGPGAPDDLNKGVETQAWLAASNDEKAKVSGKYFYHKKESFHHTDASARALQDKFLLSCYQISGISFH